MVLVDSSAWIDFWQDQKRPASLLVSRALTQSVVVVCDLVMVEVLQGLKHRDEIETITRMLSRFKFANACGRDIAVRAAENYRLLRSRGITIRGTIDAVVATWCIENGAEIIHNDRDMTLMEDALGLVAYR